MLVPATQQTSRPRSIVVHIGSCAADRRPQRVEEPLGDFVRRFSSPRTGGKNGPCFFPVDFSGGRAAANVVAVYGICLDFDNKRGVITEEMIAEKLAGLRYWAHTTHSHTPELPKFRVFIPYRTPVV